MTSTTITPPKPSKGTSSVFISFAQLPAGTSVQVGQLLELTKADGARVVGTVWRVTQDGIEIEIQPAIDHNAISPEVQFGSWFYQRHNQRRQEHLATLGLPLFDCTVLEVGAGVGDHSSFFLDRNCVVTVTEARRENLEVIRRRHPKLDIRQFDLDNVGDNTIQESFDVVYAYGILYHLSRPLEAISYLASKCNRLLLLETCVSFGDAEDLGQCDEDSSNPTQSYTGGGCRPTRPWVFQRLRENFEFVYVPTTQPWHEQFPIDWTASAPPGELSRAIFIGSRKPISNDLLLTTLPAIQTRV